MERYIFGDGYEAVAHPVADMFPLMSQQELESLAEDIKKNGLQSTLYVLCKDGQNYLVDGRNRSRACQLAGVKAGFALFPETTKEEEIIAFAMTKNLHRRHLSESQRALLGARLVPLFKEAAAERKKATQAKPGVGLVPNKSLSQSPRGHASDFAAKQVHVSRSSVESALRVMRECPELVPEIEAGRLTVHAALKLRRAVDRSEDRRCYFRHILYKYNVTEEQYWAMYERQDGKCPLCSRRIHPPFDCPEGYLEAELEHRHDNGFFRGLTCHACNLKVADYDSTPPDVRARLDAYSRRGADEKSVDWQKPEPTSLEEKIRRLKPAAA